MLWQPPGDDGIYDLPDDGPATRRIKLLAARCGRQLRRGGHAAAFTRLVDVMAALPRAEAVWWSRVVMIDHRWQGATGQGGYWAAASAACNEAAQLALFRSGVCGCESPPAAAH